MRKETFRYTVVVGARSQYPTSLVYRSVDNEKAYAKALASYNLAVSNGMSAMIYSNAGVHLRSWKAHRANLVSHVS
jgi:hypothetical protein